MGNSAHQTGSKFSLLQVNKRAAFEAARVLACDWAQPSEIAECTSLAELLDTWGWKAKEDADGNFTAISFQTEKLGNDDKLFEALGPYVVAGSYIEMHDDYGVFRWSFDGETCKKVWAEFPDGDDD